MVWPTSLSSSNTTKTARRMAANSSGEVTLFNGKSALCDLSDTNGVPVSLRGGGSMAATFSDAWLTTAVAIPSACESACGRSAVSVASADAVAPAQTAVTAAAEMATPSKVAGTDGVVCREVSGVALKLVVVDSLLLGGGSCNGGSLG